MKNYPYFKYEYKIHIILLSITLILSIISFYEWNYIPASEIIGFHYLGYTWVIFSCLIAFSTFGSIVYFLFIRYLTGLKLYDEIIRSLIICAIIGLITILVLALSFALYFRLAKIPEFIQGLFTIGTPNILIAANIIFRKYFLGQLIHGFNVPEPK